MRLSAFVALAVILSGCVKSGDSRDKPSGLGDLWILAINAGPGSREPVWLESASVTISGDELNAESKKGAVTIKIRSIWPKGNRSLPATVRVNSPNGDALAGTGNFTEVSQTGIPNNFLCILEQAKGASGAGEKQVLVLRRITW